MNIYDIAEEAGVSISTVSRVLNNKTNVTPATREKIQAVLDKYQYTPNAIARGLVVKSMKTVAILTVDMRAPYYARTAYTIERAFSRHGYNVIICNTGGELEETRRYMHSLAQRQVDGVVLVGSVFNKLGKDTEVETELKHMPVVIANGELMLPNSYSILVDDVLGIGLAVEHLARKGHRDMVYVKDLDTNSAKIKMKGFIQAMEKLEVRDNKERVLHTGYGLEGGQDAASRILVLSKRPTAVVCGEDLTAVGLMKGFIRTGLSVPRDIAVTGYNNSEYSLICTPELTTVDNKGEMSALFSVQLLESLISGKNAFSSMSIQPELVIRQST
ncbi:MAG: LacI family transcriptional regulator [Treponema sp.]|jgi:LacI family transcriptional regulator|nr:LacI family transcriptional regulator [Treponema sp.]